MAFDHNVGGHAFTERGGKCLKCGMTWNAFVDKGPDYQRACPGKKPEPRERLSIPADDD